MELQTITSQIEKAFTESEDLFKAFEEFKRVGNIEEKDMEKDIYDLVNRLCKKSKRVMLFEGEDTEFKFQIGLNPNGLGIMPSWSSQLKIIGGASSWYYKRNDKENLLKVFENTEIFNQLLKKVNKNSVKDLRKVRKIILAEFKGEDGEKTTTPDYQIKITHHTGESTKLKFDGKGVIANIKLYDANGREDDDEYYNLRQARAILEYGNWRTKIHNDDRLIMKEISSKLIDMDFLTIKVLLHLFKNKRDIKQGIKQNIKLMKNYHKALDKSMKPITEILNPLRAVDNL